MSMPKITETPRLRTHKRTSGGKTWTSYYWDGRTRGGKDVPLGSDFDKALELWAQCERGIFPEKVKRLPKPKAPPKPRTRSLAQPLMLRQPGKRRKIEAEEWVATPAWQRNMYFRAERRAIESRRSFTLTPAEFLAVLARANGCCEVSGLPFDPVADRSPFAPSLDRIECSIGYEAGNVRLVCHIANVAMNTWGIEPVLRLAEALLRKPQVTGCGQNVRKQQK
jgi:hypothetical protein